MIEIDYDEVISIVKNFIAEYFNKVRANSLVVGLSGGIDSSTLLALVSESIPRDKIIGLILPDTRVTPREDVEDAISIAEEFSVKYHLIEIDGIVDSFSVLPGFDVAGKLDTGNLRARVRMTIMYYFANKYNGIVAGSSDRSELLIGYFTKYGDGGADILPLGCLYKTQVRTLARRLGLPERIVLKPSSPRLWKDHTAEDELGVKYEDIDLVLYGVFDKGLKPDDVVKATGISKNVVDKILRMHYLSRHKRSFPPIPSMPWAGKPIVELE
ncbi:MAG: NAD+ synthase [Thermosphaera sp.]